MTAILVIEGLAIVLLAVLVVGLLRSHAEILRALHVAGVGEGGELVARHPGPAARLNEDGPADVTGHSLRGSAMHVGVSGTETNTMLAFLSSGCSSCLVLWDGLRHEDPVADLPNTRLVVVVKGPQAESQSRLEELAPEGVTVLQSDDAWTDYGVPVTPFFVLIEGQTGEIVGEGSAASWSQVQSLIGQALADRSASGDEDFRSDVELRKAGIEAGHESLYPKGPPIESQP